MANRYKCPYCDAKYLRKDLIHHIEKEHEDLLSDQYDSAEHLVYDIVNKTNGHGKCRVCKGPTSWNPKAGRYDILCGKPSCKSYMREQYKKNMIATHGTYNILNDAEQQKKMLANRSISGTYKFQDGGVHSYVGNNERKCLEFLDKVMMIPSKDIDSPGPTIQYEYNGENHFYISDLIYIPYNLIIEVKDGGANPNTKDSPGMRASRQKTIEKERIITNQGIYNYVRLTDNQFVQLIEVFMDVKQALIEGLDKKVVKINEDAIIQEAFDPKYDNEYIYRNMDSDSRSCCGKFMGQNEGNKVVYKRLAHNKRGNPVGFIEVYEDKSLKMLNVLIGVIEGVNKTVVVNTLLFMLLTDDSFIPNGKAYRITINKYDRYLESAITSFGFKLSGEYDRQRIYLYHLNNGYNNSIKPWYYMKELYDSMIKYYRVEYLFNPRIMDINDFALIKKGSDIDFTNYQHKILSNNYMKVYSICALMSGHKTSIHCFNIVQYSDNKFYYMESCMKQYNGIYGSDKLETLLYFVSKRLRDISNNYKDIIYMYEYEYSDKIIGLNNIKFIDYLIDNCETIQYANSIGKVSKKYVFNCII